MILKNAQNEYPILDIIAKRWSPRAYSEKSVEKDKLLSLFEAARWTASSFNEQPWKFIVARKEDSIKFNKALELLNDFNISWAKKSPIIILALAKKYFDHNGKENKHSFFDLGAAINSLSLQAISMDLYIHQIAGFDEQKAVEFFNICVDWQPAVVFTVGYIGNVYDLPENLQKSELKERTRKPLELIVEF